MAVNYWDQRDYENFQRNLTPGRRAEDERFLRRLFNAAAENSKTFDAALDWAFSHGIKFFVDRQIETVDGYYYHGSGIVAVSPHSSPKSPEMAEVTTHEITHAWEDFEGYMLFRALLPEELSHTFLREAHATANGRMAYCETEYAEIGLKFTRSPSEYNEEKNRFFEGWYKPENLEHYGRNLAKLYARRYGLIQAPLANVMADDAEYQPKIGPSPRMGLLDVNSVSDVFNKLGTNFDGTFYFDHDTTPDFLRKVTDPQAVLKYLDQNRNRPHALVRKILAHEAKMGPR